MDPDKKYILKGSDGADCADLLCLYNWLKQKSKLVKMGLSDNAAEILKGQDEETQKSIIQIAQANKEVQVAIKALKESGGDVTELEKKSNDLKLKMGQLSLSEDLINKLISYNKSTTDDLLSITQQLKELRYNIIVLLPKALKDETLKIDDLGIKDIELLLENVGVDNGLDEADFLG